MAEPLHKRLKKLREQNHLSIREVAKEIGVAESTYRDWENGGPVTGPPYIKLSQVLKVPLTTLMTGEPSDMGWFAEELTLLELQVSQLRLKSLPRL